MFWNVDKMGKEWLFFWGGNFQVGFSHVSVGLEVEKWALPT